MAVNVVWFMALNLAMALPLLTFFMYGYMPYPWMHWLGVPALAAALMVGLGVQMRIRHKEELERLKG